MPESATPNRVELQGCQACAEIADLMLIQILFGEPLGEEQLLGFVPMFQGTTFGTALPQPKLMRQALDLFLFPGLHISKMNREGRFVNGTEGST